MFKVGDTIEGLCNGYMGANENMRKAEVAYTRGCPVTTGIRVLEHTEDSIVGAELEVENRESMFKLAD